jgi:transposase
VYAVRRGGGLSAQALPASDLAKTPSLPRHRRVDWGRYRRFLRHGWSLLLRTLAELVTSRPPPYTVRPRGTPGRPPTDPKGVARLLLLRALEGWSFDETHAMLQALPQLARRLGFRRVPAAPTAAALVGRIPIRYLEDLVQTLAARLVRPKENLAGDGTGLTTRGFERWISARGNFGRRHVFVKLHALVATRARFPFFVAARVTEARINDVTELASLLDQLRPNLSIGNVALDKGYMSRRNAQAVADRGGWPVIDVTQRIQRARSQGSPAWKAMMWDRRTHRREFRCRYRRRAVIEGTFGAFKDRFGGRIRSRKPEHQSVEILGRVVVWNAIAAVYHRA